MSEIGDFVRVLMAGYEERAGDFGPERFRCEGAIKALARVQAALESGDCYDASVEPDPPFQDLRFSQAERILALEGALGDAKAAMEELGLHHAFCLDHLPCLLCRAFDGVARALRGEAPEEEG